MTTTRNLFDSRKNEIEFYYQVLYDVMSHEASDNAIENKQSATIKTVDNSRFIRILKSNFLLMLYNLTESCVKSGFEEIYEILIAEKISYTQASFALRDIWSNYEISQANQKTANDETYGKRVKRILEQVVSNAPIAISKEYIKKMTSGNLDARSIRQLMEVHDICFTETNIREVKSRILTVKKKRNSLAHGDESFDEAARELTLADLLKIKMEVLVFIEDAINGMESYYNKKLYCWANNT